LILTVRLLPAGHTIQYSYVCRHIAPIRASQRVLLCEGPDDRLLIISLCGICGISQSSISFSSPINVSSFSTPHRLSKGLSWGVSVRQWSVRRIVLIMPRLKCRCLYSGSAMIRHAPSVKRLYPTVGKHELQSSHCEASPP